MEKRIINLAPPLDLLLFPFTAPPDIPETPGMIRENEGWLYIAIEPDGKGNFSLYPDGSADHFLGWNLDIENGEDLTLFPSLGALEYSIKEREKNIAEQGKLYALAIYAGLLKDKYGYLLRLYPGMNRGDLSRHILHLLKTHK